MIRPEIIEKHAEIRQQFQNAKPFKHLCIDSFFEQDAAESLLRDFPSFDPNKAKNEFGEVGRKAVHTEISGISNFYKKLYEYLASERFLKTMSELTGIPDLLADHRMYGGGTHENLHGQGLDPHVDFNYDQDYGWHRRLNFLLYLNKEWQEGWGGTIQLHSNPRRPEENKVSAFNPIFNRAVIFETNEYSWHGFPGINLPPEKQHLSRKCLSVYLYTKTRPANEIAPPHGTFYVPYPLSSHIKAGLTLSENDVALIHGAIKARNDWIEHYQKQELTNSAVITEKNNYIKHLLSQPATKLSLYRIGAKVLPKPVKKFIKKTFFKNTV